MFLLHPSVSALNVHLRRPGSVRRRGITSIDLAGSASAVDLPSEIQLPLLKHHRVIAVGGCDLLEKLARLGQ